MKNNIKKFIKKSFLDFQNENINYNLKIDNRFINDLKKELSKYKTDEELLRSGGISIETLDRLAHGFSENDIKSIDPNELKIKWKDDLENVKYEIKQSGLSLKQWANKINLNEPIDVSYWEDKKHKRGFYIEDGHHRYLASKILNKPVDINLEIKINPIKVITPMGYDEFHRYIFNLYNSKQILEHIEEKTKVKDVSFIIKILKSKEAYDILDDSNAPDTTFQFGGCWILADALSIYYDLPIYIIYNDKKNIIEHFIVKLNSMFLDSDGIQSKNEIIKKVATDGGYDINDLYIVEYHKELNSSDIIKDIEASKKLIELFNKL